MREPRRLVAELKAEGGPMKPEQDEWLDVLRRSATVAVWKPRDWTNGAIEAALRGNWPDASQAVPRMETSR